MSGGLESGPVLCGILGPLLWARNRMESLAAGGMSLGFPLGGLPQQGRRVRGLATVYESLAVLTGIFLLWCVFVEASFPAAFPRSFFVLGRFRLPVLGISGALLCLSGFCMSFGAPPSPRAKLVLLALGLLGGLTCAVPETLGLLLRDSSLLGSILQAARLNWGPLACVVLASATMIGSSDGRSR